ncbi:hypothetical protein FRZ40_18645 [Paraburkholderia azotifigens]|uniref:Uncharacterized protein n=1 Tax=Paraburkholderia azotifigens TaxID=2057004 RepID=A0A5C6VAH6_9BURK|nr:hypothetical protein FRZ40_18645 [Paraburkholderia azotifigens]
MTSIRGVSPLSLLTFFAAAKKVSAAPHRGNACSTATKSRMPAQQDPKPDKWRLASQTKQKTYLGAISRRTRMMCC